MTHTHLSLSLSHTHMMQQVLLTGCEFRANEGSQHFLQTLNCLLDMKVVPILNANDVHSPAPQMNSDLLDVSILYLPHKAHLYHIASRW